MKILLNLFFISIVFLNCNTDLMAQKRVDVAGFETVLKKENIQVLDVRTPEECASGKIQRAQNINWNDPNFATLVAKLDKTKPLAVYCAAGGRSARAAAALIKMGFKDVIDLNGGITAWKAAGKKIL